MTSREVTVDAVRTAVASPSTCTPATAIILSDLLLSNTSIVVVNSTATIKPTSEGTSMTRSRPTRAPKSATANTTNQRDGKQSGAQLSPKEKAILATEVINATLKALSSSSKTTSSMRHQPSTTDPVKSSRHKTSRRSNSLPQAPLQPRCLNRVSSSPSIDTRSSCSPSSASITSSSYRAIAECSRIAFSCMRELEISNTSCMIGLPPLQLENGMSALIGKLIALGFDDLALKELRMMKRRLDGGLRASSKQLPNKNRTSDSIQATAAAETTRTLVDLLDFEVPPSGGASLILAITTQLHVLKLIASYKKPSLIAAALPKLQTEYQSSPIRLLLRSAEESSSQAAKAARQLQILSQLILSLCPNISTAEDEAALAPKLSVLPEVALRLQTLALYSRVLWWKLCDHQGDLEKDVLGPFFRCLAAFTRRSPCNAMETYKRASQAFQTIREVTSNYPYSTAKDIKPALNGIYKLLGSVAQDAGCFEDAMGWLESLQENSTGAAVSEVQRCAIGAGLVALKLLTSPKDRKVEELLMNVLEVLNGPLKGEGLELDELLSEVSKARRAAISLLQKRRSGLKSNAINAFPDGICEMCESLVLLCPRFSMRYLGKRPDPRSAVKMIVRYEQRRLFVSKSGFHTVDSAVFLIKTLQSEKRLTWGLMDSTLQDCLQLLEDIGGNPPEATDRSTIAAASYFVKISHLYYTQHLNMRQDAQGSKDIQHLRPLRRAIDCVLTRSPPEKKAALVNSKLERVADIYRLVGSHDEARESLLILRNELIGSGVLSTVAKAGGTMPARAAWDQNEDTSMLSRAIASLIKLELRFDLKLLQLPFYDVAWPIEEKGIVLEHFLDVLSRHPKEALHMQRNIFLELLAVYDPRTFPIRRLRVITRLLRLDVDQRRDLAGDVKNALVLTNLESVLQESEDSGLLPYLPHLQALASSVIELQEDHPRIDLLRPHLVSWCSTLEECKEYKTLTSNIDNIPDLLNHLLSIADFLHMKGFAKIRLAVLRMITNINEIPRPGSCPDDLVLCYVSLGLQYLELGYSGKAGLALDKAQSYASHDEVTREALLRLQLAYAEYSLTIGNADRCEETLLQAQAIALKSPDISATLKTSGTLLQKTCLSGLTADAHLVHSLLAWERGALETALDHARQNVKLIRFSWVKLAMQMKSKIEAPGDNCIEGLAEDVAILNVSTTIPPANSSTHEQVPGPSAWALVNPLFRGLSHLSSLYAHHGMFQETNYYAEQAHKLVELADSGAYVATALTATGNTWLSTGALGQALELLVKAKELSISFGDSQTSVVLSCHLGSLHKVLGNREAGLAAYENAQSTLERLSNAQYISDLDRIKDSAAVLEEEMSRLTLQARKPTGARTAVAAKKVPTKKSIAPSKYTAEAGISASDECQRLASLRGFLLRGKAGAFMLWKRCEEAVAVLREAENFSRKSIDSIDQHMAIAKQLLLQSVEQMVADPVYSVLQDSTISFPSVVVSTRVAGFTSEKPSGTRTSPPRKLQVNSSTRDRHVSRSSSPLGFFDKLRQAQEHLIEAYSVAVQVSSTIVIHRLSSLLNAITILLSAAGPSPGKAAAYTGFAICSLEMARNIALQRERKIISGNLSSSAKKVNDFQWPAMTNTNTKRSNNALTPDALCFQKEYIDIIPQAWTVISISLTESRHELCVTKMQAGHSPFVLRLPLGRNNSRDIDEQVFDFDQGKTELLEIVELANQSSHGARDLIGKGAKTAWWAERDELDARLKGLLENIEKVWLGGFKGIFSQHRPRPDMLARFQKSFQIILDKHLPSRQNLGKKGKSPKVTLDTRILELFIGLGEAFNEDCDLDEALTDLLYFVVDILQFQGERNAYDEIDFDYIVIETLDALRNYHEAMLSASTSNGGKHTILILDKALHAFPWESLPCMDGLAVSRLPSLDCLRERLLKQKGSSESTDAEGHHINRLNGTYVLNPGGDLNTTQSTFESDLQSLSTWDGITKREPSEAEMKASLETKDLFLYFGHGSGAQYIRSKAIKRLEKCAVTILMGCSSGALTERGEFEPHGPPLDYMLAGSPALVATLWDVTDKDIDRFARSTFEHWGLFEHKEARDEPSVKGKGKKKMEKTSASHEKMSLVEAVAKGRKACNYKYLTAAAVCVYGIPVYFK